MNWFRGISFKLFSVCLILVLLCVGITILLIYNNIKGQFLREQTAHQQALLQKMGDYLGMYWKMVQNVQLTVFAIVDAPQGNEAVIQNQMSKLYEANSLYFSDIYIIKKDLSIVGSSIRSKVLNEQLQERAPLLDEAKANPYHLVVSSPYKTRFNEQVITIAKYLRWQGEDAALAMDLDLKPLERDLQNKDQYGHIKLGILDKKGIPIAFGSELQQVLVSGGFLPVADQESFLRWLMSDEARVVQGGNGQSSYSILKYWLPQLDWVVLAGVDDTLFTRTLERVREAFVIASFIGFFLSMLIAVLVSRYIRKPLRELMRYIDKVKQGNLQVQVRNCRKDEFGQLSESFGNMLERIRELIRDLNVTEELKRQMEIQVLQSQMNPHFLYNTLGSISNVIALGRYSEVDPIIRALISILEYGVADHSEEVSIEEELNNVRNYLLIQNVRYGRCVELKVDAEPACLNGSSLRMVLQPIVENSLFHGYCGGSIEGSIDIGMKVCGHVLTIEIKDQGTGISADKAALVLTETFASPRQRKRVGLYNIHKRIQLFYGEAFGLNVSSPAEGGTAVRITLPYQEKRGHVHGYNEMHNRR